MALLKRFLGGAVLAAAFAAGARAEVVDPQPNGFSLQQKIQIAAPPDKVYAALIDIAKWWSPSHTFSSSATPSVDGSNAVQVAFSAPTDVPTTMSGRTPNSARACSSLATARS